LLRAQPLSPPRNLPEQNQLLSLEALATLLWRVRRPERTGGTSLCTGLPTTVAGTLGNAFSWRQFMFTFETILSQRARRVPSVVLMVFQSTALFTFSVENVKITNSVKVH
jgi:hypothetical protein